MSTITTDFPTASVRRSHPARFTDGVVAGYIHALAGASRVGERVQPSAAIALSTAVEASADADGFATEPGEMVDTAIEASRSQTPRAAGRARSACWNRGGRVTHAMRAQRVLEAH